MDFKPAIVHKGKARPHAESWHLGICEAINCLDNLFSLALVIESGIKQSQWSESQGKRVVIIPEGQN